MEWVGEGSKIGLKGLVCCWKFARKVLILDSFGADLGERGWVESRFG